MTFVSFFDSIFTDCSNAFKQNRIAEKVKNLAYGLLICFGRHTVSGMITGTGKQFTDWSSTYRIFTKDRIQVNELFKVVTNIVVEHQTNSSFIFGHLDDTLIRKTGKKIPGTSWKRDPLGPPFHTNFVWGQRFLQISLSLANNSTNCQSRAIPVDFHHCPTPTKPKKNASKEEIDAFKKSQKELKLTLQASLRINELRNILDKSDAKDMHLILSVDGSYTNDQVLKNLPKKTTIIGRIRKDASLFSLPTTINTNGRKKVYGDKIDTPEEVRQNEDIPWIKVDAWAAGKTHCFNVKIIKSVKWKHAGQSHTLQLVIIRPLGYRLSKGAKMLYRQPAYLICTDNELDINILLQAYLWRWEIEVNFRDEKTIMGCGQAQVRNINATKNLPAFTTAVYSIMHLAAYKENLKRGINVLPKAKWDHAKSDKRLSTTEILNLFRAQVWTKNSSFSFTDFVKKQDESKNHQNFVDPLVSAMFYCRK